MMCTHLYSNIEHLTRDFVFKFITVLRGLALRCKKYSGGFDRLDYGY